jgi:hypothetical protein
MALLCMAMLAGSLCAATRDDDLLVDPTVPLSIALAPEETPGANGGLPGLSASVASYELDSVLIRANDRFAVVSGQRVRVGDSVGAARVTAIESDHVTLNLNGKVERLELYRSSIKTLVKGDE